MPERVGPMDLGESQALFEASLDEAAKLDKPPPQDSIDPTTDEVESVEQRQERAGFVENQK